MTITPDDAPDLVGQGRVSRAATALRTADPATSIDWDAVEVQDLLRVPDLDTADVPRDDAAADLPGRLERTRRRRATVALGGAAALVAAGGLAAAAASGFFDGPRPEVAGVQCLSGSSTAVLGAIGSGSPIDACVKMWESTGQVPSDLVMASLPDQVVIVVPRAELPPGATVLDAPPAIDPRMAELSDALTDHIRGVDLGRACRSAADVQRRIDEITGELGLSDTPVTRRSEGGPCAFALLDSDGHSILMFLRPPPDEAGTASSDRRWELFVGDLAALTKKPGASVAELKSGVEAAAARRLGVAGRESVQVNVVPTTAGASPRLYLRAGGIVQINIYAPE